MSDPFQMPLRGLHLLEASAGTGKTWTLMVLYLRQVLERALMPDKILAVTFTNASAAELRRRIRAVLSDAEATFRAGRPIAVTGVTDESLLEAMLNHYTGEELRRENRSLLRAALSGFDRARIETIHGFCQRVLGDLAFGTATDYASVLTDENDGTRRQWLRHWFQARLDKESVPAAQRLQARFVKGGKATDFELKLLDGLAALADARPQDLQVLPAPVGRPDFEGAEAAYREAGATWLAAWQEFRGAVREQVQLDPVGFKSSQHRSDSVAKAFAAWDAWTDDVGQPKWLERFVPEVLATAWQGDPAFLAQPFWGACEGFLAKIHAFEGARAQLEIHLQQELIGAARIQLRQDRLARGELSFDDLLQNLRSAVESPAFAASLAEQLPVMLIDEFQDTDPVQWSIFSTLFRAGKGEQSLYLVGDPKQAIYSFRNADLHTYLTAAESEGVEGHYLATNYRSEPELVDAINSLYLAQELPFVLPQIEFHPVAAGRKKSLGLPGAPLTLCLVDRKGEKVMTTEVLRQAIAEDVATQIRTLIAGGLPADRIAVLVRKGEEAQVVISVLRRHGVPAVIAAQEPLYQSPIAGELLLLLRALLRLDDRRAMVSAMGTCLLGYTAEEIRAATEVESCLADVRERFARWYGIWRRWGAFPMLQSLLQECQVPSRLLAEQEGQRALTNLRQLMELLHSEQRRVSASPAVLLAWYEERIRRDGREERRLATEADAVEVVTVHKAKGLQWDVVFCSFLWSQRRQESKDLIRFHRPGHGLSLQLVAKPVSEAEVAAQKAAIDQRNTEAEAEQARLLYVALTRARERCIVHLGALHEMAKKMAYRFFAPGYAPVALSKMSDEQLAGALLAVPGRIEVIRRPHPERLRSPLSPVVGRVMTMEPVRQRNRTAIRQWRRLSYSGLARDLEKVDHQEVSLESVQGSSVPLAAFPKGARIGDFFHMLFEHHLQGSLEVDELEQMLRRHGLAGAMALDELAAIFDRLRTTPVSGPNSLATLTAEGQLPEASFLLPLVPGFRPHNLAEAIEHHGGAEWSDYGRRLGALSTEQLSGFLTGSIDLVYRHEGRWGLVDYKSNHLGDYRQNYSTDSMARVMAEHHYSLQGLIYSVAVLRMIRRKEPEVDPLEVFDGARFFFLRGADEPGYGVYQLPINKELLLALDQCFAPGAQR